jgi:hypothetical protein
MSLLDRFRRDRDGSRQDGPVEDEGSPTPPETPAPTPVAASDDVIRAEPRILGDWSYLPPMARTIPDMPLVVPPIEQSLISHQLPQPFPPGLGHLVSDDAPAGFVQPVAVLALPELSQPDPVGPAATGSAPEGWSDAGADLPLPLATPPVRETPPRTEANVAAQYPRVPPLPVAPLLQPMEPVVQAPETALVHPEPSEQPSFMEAPFPADLPLIPMPSSPLSEEMRSQLAAAVQVEEPTAPPVAEASYQPPTPTAELIGDRPLADPAAATAEPLPARAGEESGPRPAGAPADATVALPLAVPPPAPPDLPAAARPAPPAPREGEPAESAVGRPTESSVPEPVPEVTPPVDSRTAEPAELARPDSGPAVAPLLGPSAPLVGDPIGRAPVSDPDAGGAEENLTTSGGLPLAAPSPTEPAAERRSEAPAGVASPEPVVAPLVGDTAPLVATPAEPTPAPADGPTGPDAAGRPRSGLGAPLTGLPPSSRSYDFTTLSRAQQQAMTRSMMGGRLDRDAEMLLAQPALTAAREAARGTAATPLSAPGPVAATPLPQAPDAAGHAPAELSAQGDRVAPLIPFNDMIGSPGSSAPTMSLEAEHEGAAVRAEVGTRFGLDLAHVPVDRSPDAALEAHLAGARAFTTESGIVIPPAAGTLNGGEGAALLAHELTHVAQRARIGRVVPDEASPQGRLLEGEARRTEMVYARGQQLADVLGPPSSPDGAASARSLSTPSFNPPGASLPVVAAHPLSSPSLTPLSSTLPLAASAGSVGPDTEAIANTVLERVSTMIPSPAPYTEVFGGGGMGTPATAGMQRAEVSPAPTPAATPPEAAQQPTESGMPRPTDEDLTNLSKWLYPLIRYRLKRELREDRERAGLLTDHYRRW